MRRESNGALWRDMYALFRALLPDTCEMKVVYKAVLWNNYNKAQEPVQEWLLSVCLHRVGVGVCRCGDSPCIVHASYTHLTCILHASYMHLKSIHTTHTHTHLYAQVRARFFEAYKGDMEMGRMDAVVCSHPAAACEVYLALDIPIILFVTTRFDLGRLHSPLALQVSVLCVRAATLCSHHGVASVAV